MPNGGCCRKYSYSQKGASLIARKLDENLCLKFAISPFTVAFQTRAVPATIEAKIITVQFPIGI